MFSFIIGTSGLADVIFIFIVFDEHQNYFLEKNRLDVVLQCICCKLRFKLGIQCSLFWRIFTLLIACYLRYLAIFSAYNAKKYTTKGHS